ncbi:hypothetical protein GCM10011506_29880 [Marivirga lumbricoides]|uniref:Uncharacterized protein n=1 Tax=Marivirga lumbricoides TaxID=1046115 RepID=A0ABQ1MKQ1_9BACT|nr:hypothetical protein GCM10011506_29880 [Marivirga lumbricoides]
MKNEDVNQPFRLNTTLNMGHMLLSSISLLIVVISMWVNVHVKLAKLELEVNTQKEKHINLKLTQDKLLQQINNTTTEMTKLLYEIKIELKDKADKLTDFKKSH